MKGKNGGAGIAGAKVQYFFRIVKEWMRILSYINNKLKGQPADMKIK